MIAMRRLQLPQPDPDALAASHALAHLIAQEIRAHDGQIPFARFMELALYAPMLGYYSGGAAKLGAHGDFTTAPEISSLFGAALAQLALDIMPETAPLQLMEFGAGSGKLARDMLTELAACGRDVESYAIVELSGELRARQQQALRDFPQVCWLDRLPPSFSGLVIGNEVLDAMPVELVVKRDGAWQQRMVGLADADDGSGRQRPVWRERACDADLLTRIMDQMGPAETLPDGYLTEIHPSACGFIASLAEMMSGAGSAAIFIDYGFPAHEYYLPQRAQGTLMCHYRHHAHGEPFFLPGLQDITAHVDFSAMARNAQDRGLEVLAYMSQAAFLLDAGLTDLLLRTDPNDAAQYLPQANAVQKLLSPAEMGELFKVLVLGKNMYLPPKYQHSDRQYRL
jgi:SAM-dependent MidA family methyltransferase